MLQLDHDADTATLTRISAEEGLTQGTVVDIFQDSDGFMWLSTSEGLNFYNGYDVRPFDGPANLFNAAYFKFIHQDTQGLFWFSVFEHGLYTFNPKTNETVLRYSTEGKPEKDFMAFLDRPEQQRTWFFTTSGLLEYSYQSQEFISRVDLFPQMGDEHFITSVEETFAYFWVGTNKGLMRIHKADFKVENIAIFDGTDPNSTDIFEQRVRRIKQDNNGQIWIATAKGLFVLNPEEDLPVKHGEQWRLRIQPLIPQLQFHDLLVESNRILAASNRGLIQVDPNKLEASVILRFSDSNYDVFNDRIIRLSKDFSGNYWLASNSRGVYVWNPKTGTFKNRFNTGNGERKLSSNEIWSVKELEDNVLWVGTTDGLNRVDLMSGEHQEFLTRQDENSDVIEVVQVEVDAQQKLWLATYNGIKLFDPKTASLQPIKSADPQYQFIFDEQQSYLKFDSQERIWISTLDSFYILEPSSGEITELTALKETVNPYYSFGFIGELPGKNLMLLSASGQIWGVNTQTFAAQLIYELESYTPQEFVYVDNWLLDNQKGYIWLSFTTFGLVALSYDDFRVVEVLRDFPADSLDTVYGIMLDQERRMWFSSHDGIFNYGLDNQHLMKFGTSYGLAALEYNSGAWTQLRSGALVYGGVKGLTWFDPAEIGKGNDRHNRVVVDSIKVQTNELPSRFTDLSGQTVKPNYDDAGIDISFSTLGFNQQQRVQYQYQLAGEEVVTYPVTRRNKVSFSHLSPGHYTLSVKAISPVTGFTTKPSKIHFDVAHAPWNSPLARAFYVFVLALFLMAIFYRRRLKQKALVAINTDLKESENRLQLALKSSQSQAWEWDSKNKAITLASILDEGTSAPDNFKQHYQQIHPDDRYEFLREWQKLFSSPESDAFNFTYRIRKENNEYGWFRNVGQILERDEAHAPRRITGLITDIDDAKTAAESALVFGEAFRNTKDWVLIVDSDYNGVLANNSFYEAFDLEPNERFSLKDKIFYGLTEKMLYYRSIMEQMSVGEHWHGEDTIQSRLGFNHQVIINISLISIENREKNHYVVIFTDITQQKVAEEELRMMANYDALTSLPNRTLLIDRIEHAIQGADRNQNTLALLFIDLDRFKPINDSLGHEYGDLLLQKIADRLKERVRKQDTVARLGGDEFVVLLESFDGVTHVGEVARQIGDCIAQPVALAEQTVSITPSIGIALYPSDARSPEDLLRDADIAMYHAKKEPGQSFHFYTESMDLEVRKKLQQESDLKQAQEHQEFVNFYQPIIDAKTGDVVGAELLLRWFSKNGMVSPNDFIPLSEQIGLIAPMTLDALKRGLKDIKHWRELIPDFYLSLNLSVIHFEQDNVAEDMAHILKTFDLAPAALKVEVTESALMTHPEKAITTMCQFTRLGILLSLDDFGTGYSSFSYLKNLPLTIIKLDRSFVWGIGKDEKDESIIEAILSVADSLGLCVVAEGVEEQEHIDFLLQRKCDYFQGFHFSKPLGFDDFSQYLNNQNDGQG